MDRKAMAKETLRIIDQGYYEADGTHVDIQSMQKASVKGSFLLTPEQGEELLTAYKNHTINNGKNTELITLNCATVDAVLRLTAEGKHPAVLNFASAKNPGGGFLNGAKAQEESLAVSGCLYETQLAHETYYKKNRACGTMMYTNHAI